MEISVSNDFGGREIEISTGKLAKQAGGSVIVKYGETVVLVTVCADKKPKEKIDFIPLTIEYAEKMYAAGKIPGSFFKREMGRPSEPATLTARLIDRPIRPLFPEGYGNETQVIATVLSYDKVNEPATVALIGASAALSISNIPFNGPLAGVRVGRIDGKFVSNPSFDQLQESDLDLFVAAANTGILMVEAGGDEVSEADMIEALGFAEETCKPIIKMQEELAKKCAKEKFEVIPPEYDAKYLELLKPEAAGKIDKALRIKTKLERYDTLSAIKDEYVEKLTADIEIEAEKAKAVDSVKFYLGELKHDIARNITLNEGKRIDGRNYDEIRNIWGEVSFLPRTHGSSVFTRGETQALVTCTLGTKDDEQMIDTLEFNKMERFLLHYNFPPYSVGEVKRPGGPGRRELGHGNLARRSLIGMLPSKEEFDYTIRLVSEVLESNGSSSMATVCGGTMALLDAGVPLKSPVAGIAMGLIKDGDKVAILSDILGDEDHFGDMDFKVCGTEKGITALQMDIKIDGLDKGLLTKALEQARKGRLHILGKMQEVIGEARGELSEFAPVKTAIKVNSDKIKIVIGPGGKNIKNIIAVSGAKIEVDETGMVNIISSDPAQVEVAKQMVKDLVAEPEPGTEYEGTVKRIVNFGAFVEIMPRVEGLLHISEIDHKRVNNVEEYFQEGDKVRVVLLSIENDGKMRLSRKALIEKK